MPAPAMMEICLTESKTRKRQNACQMMKEGYQMTNDGE
jgi:hypothetical protein